MRQWTLIKRHRSSSHYQIRYVCTERSLFPPKASGLKALAACRGDYAREVILNMKNSVLYLIYDAVDLLYAVNLLKPPQTQPTGNSGATLIY